MSPILSVSPDNGFVGIYHHTSPMMYQPLVKNLLDSQRNGSVCVLTQTNEEAVILVALLKKHGVNSKLVQSMDGFRFWNIAEVRMFLKQIEQHTKTPVIVDEVWEEAKCKTYSKYENSTSLQYLRKCISLFEQTNKTKYLTDFKEFIYESSVEDFYEPDESDVVVSTIHKAKGREYDDVYMLLSEPQHINDEEIRRYYVGATRAKQRLFIHTNSSMFDCMPADEICFDEQQYEMPDEIVLQLTHKDVNLGFFKPHKKEILALRAGEKLQYKTNYLFACQSKTPACKLSQKMQGEINQWVEKGYYVSSASIRFIVAWKPKEAPADEEETAVILADLTLEKMKTEM